MSDYLSDKKQESSSDDDLFGDNVAKSKKQLENSVALFKELIRMRKKKLLNLVFVATETGIMKRDYENMFGPIIQPKEMHKPLSKSDTNAQIQGYI